MGMYNMIFGMNSELAIVTSTILGFRVDKKFPRFRDIFDEDDDAPFKADIYIYTRMGGNNASCWGKWDENTEKDSEGNCLCPACIIKKLEENDWIVGHYDDSYDNTYRTYGINFTPKQKAELESLKNGTVSDDFMNRMSFLFPNMKEEE